MTFRNALLAVSLLTLPVAAIAQPINGLYISGGVGANFLADTNLRSSGGVTGKLVSQTGFDGFGSLGWGYGNGFRTEAEIVGTNNSVKARFSGVGTIASGQGYLYGVMVNGLYDISTNMGFTPYIGAGFGYVAQQVSITGAKSGALGSIAAQGIVGVAVPVAPQLDVTFDYRLLDKLQNRNVGVPPYGFIRVGNEVNHSINVGVRYALGAAPMAVAAPAPAPIAAAAPAPAPARSYLVFFDWDKADLTARAQQIIAEAARNATKVGSTRIDVAGHADKSGTAAYNQTLSLARANNVAAELVRLGVAKTAISITAFGDTKPLVPTADGVREPQNRRVEIVLR